MKVLLILASSVFISGCDLFGKTGERPWTGHSLNKGSNQQEYWLVRAETREWCMVQMEEELGAQSESWNKKWYSKPAGCAFKTNNLPLSIYYYETVADKSLYTCIARRLEPSAKKSLEEYWWMVDGHPEIRHRYECVWE